MTNHFSYRSLINKKIELETEYEDVCTQHYALEDPKRFDTEKKLEALTERMNRLGGLIEIYKPTCSLIYHKTMNILSNTNRGQDRFLEREINKIHFLYKLNSRLNPKSFVILLTRKLPTPQHGLFEAERYAENELFRFLAKEIKKLCSAYLLKFSIRPNVNPPNGTIAFWDLRHTGFKLVGSLSV